MESWLKPMLCGKADVVPTGDDWIAEPKFDGWRAIAHIVPIDADTQYVDLYCGRNGAGYSGKLPYIESVLADLLPQHAVVDGELIGGEWGDVQGVMTRGQGPHIPTQLNPALTYVVFDLLWEDERTDLRPVPWHERRNILERYLAGAPPEIQLAPVGESSEATLEEMLKLGMEGIVCKRRDARYENKRSNAWIKIKPQDTEDGTLIGFYEATAGSKYAGNSVGGICFRLDNGYEGRAAGMDDVLRKEMYDHPERFIGRTVELRHHGVQKGTGALRHPQFFRFRDDKDPPKAKPKAAPKMQKGGNMRNYGAMGDKKLLACIKSLEGKSGDAYDRCLNGGSGEPDRDLEVARQIAKEKGLL